MKTRDLLKRLLVAFVISTAAYAVLYTVIEHRRSAKGPWQVNFTQDDSGAPAILINQPATGITNFRISFLGRTNTITDGPVTMNFREARRTPFEVPFGKCQFQDTVFLPGTIVLELFGHQIQLMPRALTLDGVEHSWHSGGALTLTAKTNGNAAPR